MPSIKELKNRVEMAHNFFFYSSLAFPLLPIPGRYLIFFFQMFSGNPLFKRIIQLGTVGCLSIGKYLLVSCVLFTSLREIVIMGAWLMAFFFFLVLVLNAF